MPSILNSIFFISLFVTTFVWGSVPKSGCDVITKDGKCFSYFAGARKDWSTSGRECATWGGYLATVSSSKEDAFLDSIRTVRRGMCWIGLNDIQREGVRKWADGSNSSYRNWQSGEPSCNNKRCRQRCVDKYWRSPRWDDDGCSKRFRCYFCSSEVDPIGILKNISYSTSQNMTIYQDTTLSCITENKNTPHVTWSYVDLVGSRSVLSSTTDVTTGVSILTVTIDKPGYYSCQVTRDNGVSRTYTVSIFNFSPQSLEREAIANGSVYGYFSLTRDRNTALRECIGWGGLLTTIESIAEDQFLFNLANSSNDVECWIGLEISNRGSETIIWVDGSTSTYRNYPGLTTNTSTDDKYYSLRAMNGSIAGGWDPHFANESISCFICKKKINQNACDLTNNGSCYRTFESNSFFTWDQTQESCVSWGGNLASITSQEENDYLALNTPYSGINYFDCWIGLTNMNSAGYYWIDGTEYAFSDLQSPGGLNTCARYKVNETKSWDTYDCSSTTNCWICKKNSSNLYNTLTLFRAGIHNDAIFEIVIDNTVLFQNTTLYCTAESNLPVIWTYVDINGNISVLNASTDLMTGVSTLTITTDESGYYLCQVTRNDELNDTQTVGLFSNHIYTVITSMDNPINRTYTIGLDREEIFLFCNSFNSSISLTDIKWRVTVDNRTFPNPLIPHSNMLLQSGTSYGIQCVDTRTNNNILSSNYLVQGPPVITLNNATLNSFSLLPPNMNSASVTVLTQNVVLSTNIVGRWQRPDNSFLASNTLTFSTFYVTQGGVYKFYVDNWDGQETLAIQLDITIIVTNVFGTLNASTYTELPNNQIVTQDATLYCITENTNPWSYVDLAGNIIALNATVNHTTGISTLSVTTDEPGYYSCQVIHGSSNVTYNSGIFDFANYTVFGSDGNAPERTYTIGIDREEIFLFCNSSNSSISLTDIKWRVTGDNRTFPNPLIPHSNMLLQSGTSYSIQCVDTRTNSNILNGKFSIQDNQELALNPNLTKRLITIGGGNVSAECIDPYQRGLEISWNNITTLPENHGVNFIGNKLIILNNRLPTGIYVFECVGENMRAKKSLNLTIEFLFANSSLITINEIKKNENATLTEINRYIELVLTYSNEENTAETFSTNKYESLVNATLILSKNLRKFASEVSNDTINSLVQVTSILLEISDTIGQENTNQLKVSTTKLVSVIEILGAISLSGLNANVTQRVFTSERVDLISQIIPLKNDTVEPLTIPKSENPGIIETVSMPRTVVGSLSSDGEFRYSIAVIIVFQTSYSDSDFSLGSSLFSLTVSTEKERINLRYPIQLTFYTPNLNNRDAMCVFLDEENSMFDSTGLSLNSSEGNLTVCESNHLTSFGVLIRIKDQNVNPQERIALSIISYILLSCSLIALILSILVSIVIGKEFFKVEMNKIYFNYALALAFAITVFIFGTELPRSNTIACSVFVGLMHYFWLAVFSWGLCISVEIVYLLWITSLNRKALFWFLLPFGWGLPIPIVVTTFVVSHFRYKAYIHQSSEYCFISYSNGMIWSFIGPILVMLFLNMIGLILAFVKIVSVTKSSGKKSASTSFTIAKQSLMNSSLLFPVLGAPWIILPFNLVVTSFISTTVLEWLFIILTTPSGILFFILFTLRNDIIRQKLSRKNPSSPNPSSSKINSSGSKCNAFRKNRQQGSTSKFYTNEMASSDVIPLTEMPITEKSSAIVSKKQSLKSISSYVMPDLENLGSIPEYESVVPVHFNKISD